MVDIITAIGKLRILKDACIGVRISDDYLFKLTRGDLFESYYLTMENGKVVLKNLINEDICKDIMEEIHYVSMEDIGGKFFADSHCSHIPASCILENKWTLATILSLQDKKLKNIARNDIIEYVILDTRNSEVYKIHADHFEVYNWETQKYKVRLEEIPVYKILDDDQLRYKVIVYKVGTDWKKLDYYHLLENGID